MKGFLWPAGLPHVTPIRGEFLCHRTAPIEGTERVLARDGRIPLLWFFQKYPNPQNFSGKIFIHHRLASLVPEAWLAHTGTYSLTGGGRGAVRERLFVGTLEEAQCRWERLELPSSPEGLPVSVYIALRTPDFDRHENLAAEFLLQLGARLGRNVRVLSWPEFLNRASFEGCEVFDLGRGILCSDNYLVQHVLSRGGSLFGGDEESEGGTLAAVSPHHSLRVREQMMEIHAAKHSVSAGYFQNYSLVNGEPRGDDPWPRWFADWCAAYA